MRLKKLISGITSLALSLSAFAGLGSAAPQKTLTAEAGGTSWKFDFGSGGTAGGYTGVSASDGYSSSKGYGFAQTGSVSNVLAGGSDALNDAVQFNSDDTGNTFNVDLPKGLYQVKVTTGNSPRTTIRIEGMVQMMNLTGTNAAETIQIPVTDGQLNVQAITGMSGAARTIASLEVTQLNDTGTMKPTIWICGDSTVANYYNVADTSQHGWGQLLGKYVDTGYWEIRNQATSGQYAKGFYDSGQFAPVECYGKPGDIYIISIGINDSNYSNKDEYTEVVTSMVRKAKAKGMTVLLVKQQGRHGDLKRSPLLTGRWYGGQLDAIGAAENVEVIDLFTAWQNFGLSLGYDAMYDYYAIQANGSDDDLHQSKKGSDKLAQLMSQLYSFDPDAGSDNISESLYYSFRNVNSGLYMDVADGNAAIGANVQQSGKSGDSASSIWRLQSSGDGYYYIWSMLENGNAYVLDVTGAKTANGTNIEIYVPKENDAQKFRLARNPDDSYRIIPKVGSGKLAVDIANSQTSPGANVQIWELTGGKSQDWLLESVTLPAATTTAAAVTTVITTTTTTATTAAQTPTAPKRTVGDANEDNSVTIADATAILQHLGNKDKYGLSAQGKLNADVVGGGDGVTAADAVFLQQYDAGMVELPADTAEPEVTTTAADPHYYAVDQVWDAGSTEDIHSGFTKTSADLGISANTGYVNLDNIEGSSITFTVNADISGNYMTHIRFANGSTLDRKTKIFVNGNTDTFWLQSFPSTGGWTAWLEYGIVLPLKAGRNTIRFESAVSEGGPNFDYITLTLTDEPIAETWDPAASPELTYSSKPALYLAGDSTCMYYNASKQADNGGPIQGWGYDLADNFTDGINIYNHAIAGRSSKKFYDEGRFATITNNLKAGDFVMIQFAINDAGAQNADRYAPTCGNVDSPAEGSYEWYMTSFIKDTLAKGATPIIMSCTLSAKSYSNGKFTASYTNFTEACQKLASKYSVPFIDVNRIMTDHYNSVGYNTAVSYHMAGAVQGSTDYTHFNENGAKVIAQLIANAVKSQKIAGLYSYVK